MTILDPHPTAQVPRAAAWLGGAGLIPFAAGAFAHWTLAPAHSGAVIAALLGYGAVILSFMGAVHWGLAMALRGSPAVQQLSLSVVPPLVAWAALLVPPLAGIAILAAAFAGVYAMDRSAVAAGIAPPWYLRLRTPLSAAVISLLAVSGAALGTRLS